MSDANQDTVLLDIIALIRNEAGIDFMHYKTPSIKRRIERRTSFHKLKTINQYAELLAEKPEELKLLCQEILITVTEFFRDPETYRYLKKDLIPNILSLKSTGQRTRIWIPGCATGEEVYSIAISILETLDSNSLHHPVQIFGTDLNKASIAEARKGEYSAEAVSSLSPKQLKQYFTKAGDNYRINKTVRDLCVFAPHNILNDPPFSHVDLISCRNLLIYLDPSAQKKVISTFHYALNKGGYLMLGKLETTGSLSLQFHQVNKKFRIYLRKDITGTIRLPELFANYKPKILPAKSVAVTENKISQGQSFSSIADGILLAQYTPACVIINQTLDILQFRGATSLYLSNQPGKASFNILEMVSPEIAMELRNAISKAISGNKSFVTSNIEIKTEPGYRIITIEVVPFKMEEGEPLLLVLFSEAIKNVVDKGIKKSGKNELLKDQRILKLEESLALAHQNLLVFAREQEVFTDELQNANEEVVSSNEELQSLNEELETSKEEIESSNEELISANQQLVTHNQLLHESYQYSEAIINTMHEPLLILDKGLRIKSANKAFYKDFTLNESETIGTSLFELSNKEWANPKLKKLLSSIISKNTLVLDFEITGNFPGAGEKIMLLNAGRIIQKSTGENLILIAIHDVTERTLFERKEKERLRNVAIENRRQNEKLEILVVQRTKELTHVNKLLEQNLESLEKINEELQAFAHVSSHDLQEPLRKIQTFVSMMMENDLPNLSERGKDQLVKIQEAAKRMRRLIQDLIAYAETTTTESNFAKSDLAPIVHGVVKDLEYSINEKEATVFIDVKATVKIIPFQFRQLIYNLLGNALKFTRPGEPPNITIRSSMVESCVLNTRRGDKANHPCCHISVSDNGMGFDEKYSDRIFTVFQKLQSKDQYEGTGIGLAIVKKIVENHKGSISVKSKPDQGTTFDIYIPSVEGMSPTTKPGFV